MNTKRFIAIALTLILALSLAACGGGNTGSSEATTGDTTKTSDSVEMGELALVIGSEAFTLPITIEDFMALGWETAYEESAVNLEKTLNPKEFTTIYLVKGEYHATSLVANLTDDGITVSQGTIVGFDDIWSETEAMLELPNGIVQGVSTRGELMAAYGEPYEVDSWGKWIRYNLEGFFVTIVVGEEENDVIGLITIKFQDWKDFDSIHFKSNS